MKMKLITFSFLLLSLIVISQSCKKIDRDDFGSANSATRKFFTVPPGTDTAVDRVINELKRQNEITGFIDKLAAKEGYAVWDKAMVTTIAKPELNTRNAISEVSDTIIYIPLVLENGKHVNSFIYAKLNGSVHLRLYRGREYSSQGYDSSRKDNAEKLTLQLMMLDKQVFGYKKFMINDCRLFKDKATDTTLQQNKHRQLTLSLNNPGANWHWEQGEVTTCTFTWEYIDDPVHSGIYISQGWVPHCQSTLVWFFVDDSGDGDNGPASSPGTGTGSGGSGGAGTPPSYPGNQQCTILEGGQIPVSCGNGNTGMPYGTIDGDGPTTEPPYVCNYQLTTHETNIFDQLDAEDAAANNNQNSECHGTNRAGNANFQGTKEHWLLQLDYLMKNPTYGEAEYAIPGASIANPANKGFADMVNTLNGNIFEIKPDNPQGVVNGTAEVQNYVNKANISCSSNLPFGTTWNSGTTYGTTFIPSGSPNQCLQARLITPGVVGYSYVNLSTNPIPSPYVIPETMLDKIKQLVERLKNNAANAKRIISEYFNEHPELLTYIKSMAIGAGVAIIVGTIFEDIVTGGIGIVDDLASFALAYRIIRFAIAV